MGTNQATILMQMKGARKSCCRQNVMFAMEDDRKEHEGACICVGACHYG